MRKKKSEVGGGCWVCGRSCLANPSHACRSCRAGKPSYWRAPAPTPIEVAAPILTEVERSRISPVSPRALQQAWRAKADQVQLEEKVVEVKTEAAVAEAPVETKEEDVAEKKRCVVAGCDGESKVRGVCNRHHQRARKLVKKGATWEELLADDGQRLTVDGRSLRGANKAEAPTKPKKAHRDVKPAKSIPRTPIVREALASKALDGETVVSAEGPLTDAEIDARASSTSGLFVAAEKVFRALEPLRGWQRERVLKCVQILLGAPA